MTRDEFRVLLTFYKGNIVDDADGGFHLVSVNSLKDWRNEGKIKKVECSCGTRTDDFEIHEKTYEILGGSCCLLSSLSEEDVKENLRRYGFTEKGDEHS
jgi:hypothetical protein